ncbi:dual specificity protein phosphatase family protein [Halorhodospira halochloris]|uniref:Tyrosine/serine protein phosphatase n=1 Tax=Halorhodospira halochloris TaxID=1052 RepID=A0A0X8X7U4_HALHR|nr:dual specificity protein phosphatase family protein [Halorhodospira halochloris]MCG5529294.1 dual specificity protein phosphatase family protein [Halorhodospira halochloris]MCG5547270.1 dual specificity protein phosphatase family protein [Halorhodospira halochloris]BAU56568.1 tyrosine/serine protein phosphatase [Halorhodospira halochloris]
MSGRTSWLQAVLDVVEGGFLNGWQAFVNTFGYYRLVPVCPDVLYRSTEMPPERMACLCLAQNIRTVIDLRRKHDRAEAERVALKQAGIKHVHLPSPQVPTEDVVNSFLEIMDDPGNYPVVIHCVHGVGRTGALLAVYSIEYKQLDNEQARRLAKRIGGFQSFGSNRPKGRFLISYVPRRERAY